MATKLAFTTLRDDQGDALFWHSHWQRLARSWHYFKDSELTGKAQLYERLKNYWQKNSNTIIRIELLGDGSFELVARPFICRDDEPIINLKLSNMRQKEREYPSWLKAGDYSKRLQARDEAKENGFEDLLYLDENNHVTEASVANIIWGKGANLYAPKESKYFLQGITTKLFQSKFTNLFKIDDYRLDNVLAADAVWLVNALNAPIRVTSIGEKKFATGVPQVDLDQLYWELVKIDRKSRL